MAKRMKELSAAEWEIMNALWDLGRPSTVREVLDAAYPKGEKAYTTVQTVMNILVTKGVLRARKHGPVNMYSAVLSRERMLTSSLSAVAGRMFGGSFGAMTSYLVNTMPLSDDDVAELRKLLDAYEE